MLKKLVEACKSTQWIGLKKNVASKHLFCPLFDHKSHILPVVTGKYTYIKCIIIFLILQVTCGFFSGVCIKIPFAMVWYGMGGWRTLHRQQVDKKGGRALEENGLKKRWRYSKHCTAILCGIFEVAFRRFRVGDAFIYE
ncbi:MAG: hypothetical protein ACOX7F_07740 [Eubacteriales bacterium]